MLKSRRYFVLNLILFIYFAQRKCCSINFTTTCFKKKLNLIYISMDKKILDGKKILWVEDDKFITDIVYRKLNKEGCDIIYAGNGEEALMALETKKPDIIMLDI